MKLHEHLITSLIFFGIFWFLVYVDFFGKLPIQLMIEDPIEIAQSIYYWMFGVLAPDIDLIIMKLNPKFVHRNIATHSFLWAIPSFFEHNIASGVLCFTLGLHLLCDLTRTLADNASGHFQEVHLMSKPLGKRFSIGWFIINGIALTLLGILFMVI